jgi:hypothetical protein
LKIIKIYLKFKGRRRETKMERKKAQTKKSKPAKKNHIEEKKAKLKKTYKFVGVKSAVEFIKKEFKLPFSTKGIENQIIRKKIGKILKLNGRKIRVFSSPDVEKLKKLYSSYVVGEKLRKIYPAIGIRELSQYLKKFKLNYSVKNLEALLSRLAKKNIVKKKYEKIMGKRTLIFSKDTIRKIVSYLSKKAKPKTNRKK